MRRVTQTSDAPAAIGPYSQAIEVAGGRLLFVSGQIHLDPKTGELVGATAQEKTERVMENLRAVLLASGMDFSNVVKTTIYLTDLGDFSKVNEVYGRYFRHAPPARATVQVAALPKGANVEIDAVAVSSGTTP